VKQDVKRALELAAASEHPQCQWLTELFARKTVKTADDARDVFLSDEKRPPQPASLCFVPLFSQPVDEALLRQSAELGYCLAQARMVGWMRGDEMFLFAKSAASQREREGFHWRGFCCESGIGCDQDLQKAREFFLVAAQLGHIYSMNAFGRLLDASDPQRWLWWGRAAVLGESRWFLYYFSRSVEKFNSGSGNAASVFQIGKALNGHVSVEHGTIFGLNNKFDNRIGHANSAISFYLQCAACRRAVDAWSVCAARIGVVKDIRVLIGKLVWETRVLALYKV
jgi:hypothetical protein